MNADEGAVTQRPPGALRRACEAVDALLGAGSAGRLVERVEPHRDGGFTLTVDDPSAARWFRASGDTLAELLPKDDHRLALCVARADELHRGEWRVLSWRPSRRIVLREGDGPSAPVWKGFRRGKAAGAAERHRAAERALAAPSTLSIPTLLTQDDGLDALAFAPLGGRHVRVHADDAPAFQRLGEGLRDLRRTLDASDLPRFTAHDELAALDAIADRATSLGVPLDGWDPLRAEVEHALAELPEVAPVATHRDLHDGQVLTGTDGVALLDFDLLCAADPAVDPANLSAHLALRALQGLAGADERGADAATRAFLAGLDLDLDAAFRRRLRAYRAATFLRLAALYAARPRWTALASSLSTLVRRSLRELE